MATIEFTIATGIWTDLAEPTSLAVSSVSGKLVGPFVGRLNYQLGTEYTILSEAYFDSAMAADLPALYVYSLMYKQEYYYTQATRIATGPGMDWMSLADGDGRVTRSDPINRAKLLFQLAAKLKEDLILATNAYNKVSALPVAVDYFTIENPSYFGWMNSFKQGNL